MDRRPNLHELLVDIVGSNNVYFQPPSSISMLYPAIVYERSRIQTKHANNSPYLNVVAYEVTVIDRNPNSTIVDRLLQLPLCSFDRHYVSDNLYHDSFTLFY